MEPVTTTPATVDGAPPPTTEEGAAAPASNPLEAVVRQWEEDPALDPLAARVATIAEPLGHGRRGEVLRGSWLGHALHPMLTDLPVGFWTSAWMLDLVGGPSSRAAARRLVGLGLLSVPATAAAGLADWSAADHSSTRRVGAVHAACNGAASLCYLESWRQRRNERHGRGIAWGMAGALAATAGGYLGGHMAFGSSGS